MRLAQLKVRKISICISSFLFLHYHSTEVSALTTILSQKAQQEKKAQQQESAVTAVKE